MSPLLSSKGRNIGKLVEGYKTSTLGLGLSSGGGSAAAANFYGDGSDGALNTTGDVTWTVSNKNGNYDGDMVYKQLQSLTINAGHKVTVDQPCRGMFLFVDGDIIINGTLSMTNKGPAANPTSSGGSDNNAVDVGGITYGFFVTTLQGDSWSPTNAFNGCGTGIRDLINTNGTASDSVNKFKKHVIGRTGGDGSPRPSVSGNSAKEDPADIRGGNGNDASSKMTGGGGAGGQAYEAYNGAGGEGGNGTCWSGGSGGGGAAGGGAANAGHRGDNANDYGGAGGDGGDHNESGGGRPCGTGGAGNPGGNDGSGTGSLNDAGDGNGGLIMIVCSGSVTIGANGSIQSHGNRGGDNTGTGDNSSMGGGSGGGHIMLASKETITASGSAVTSNHYVGSAGSQVGSTGTWGEKTYNLSCWGGRGGKNPETSHVPVQDMYTGTSTTRQGGAGGKGIISVYAGVLV